jgi:phage protein D
MSLRRTARRTEIAVKISGVDVSEDINKHLISLTYTDNEEEKTDDLRLELDDREGIWLKWLKVQAERRESALSDEHSSPLHGGDYKIGDVVWFKGGLHHYTSMGDARGGIRTAGLAVITHIARTARHPFHVVGGMFRENVGGASNVWGWVDDEQLTVDSGQLTITRNAPNPVQTKAADLKGAMISAAVIQRNFNSDGKDGVLDCGCFEIDSVDYNVHQGARLILKATSLPHSRGVRNEQKSRAWENIRLSAIAEEIAGKSKMKCMYLSGFNPLYDRREQRRESDILFLRRLCKNAGISLKISAGIIVLFDAAEYEKKAAVRKIKRGEADIKSARFSSSKNDTNYKNARVTYTDPVTKQTIDYTYTPRGDASADGITLVINEKVRTRAEARQLAMRRWRQKMREEYQAAFTLVGDVSLVAGVTVEVEGWELFDGKYIVSRVICRVTASGFSDEVTLRRCLTDN